MSRKISQKIFAIVTSLTVMSWVALPVSADTVSDLQAQIAALLAQITTLQAQLNTLQGGGSTGIPTACSGITFTVNLSQGSSGASVKCLQAILNQSADTQIAASGAGSPGNETTYFGSLTKTAVVKFQQKYAADILTPVGLTAGTGFVGSSTRAKLNSMLTSGTVTPPSGAGQNKVSLAADSPAAATVAMGAIDVIFMKVNFCAAATANTVSKIIITRTGIAADADLSAVKLYDGTTQVGATQAINSTTHKAVFSSLSWSIPANSCKVLTVKGSIQTATYATAGDTPKLSIAASADITSTVALEGTFPILSNGMTIAGISAGLVEVATSSSPSGSLIAGSTFQEVADFKFTASSTEGIKIYSVKVTEVGSSVDSDISNIKLYYQSTQLGSTVASLTNGSATFDISSAPLEVLAGNTKTLAVYADVGTGIGIQNRTIKFQITQATDVTAYGTNSGGSLNIYGNTKATDEWPLNGQSLTIVLGSLVITRDTTYSPSAQDYARGTSQDSIVAFKFSAGAYEGVRITQVKFKRNSTSISDSDISNVTLYDAVTGEVLAGPAGMVSGYVTFGTYSSTFSPSGLFDVTKGSYRIVLLKLDISSAASSSNGTLGFQIAAPTTDVKAQGLSSQNNLATSDITGTANLGSTLNHDIISTGTLTVGPNSNTPSASTYAVGTTDFTFAKFDLTSTGEDIKVTQFNVYFGTSSDSTSTPATITDINNIKLYDSADLVNPLKTVNTISSGYAQFAVNLTVPKNSTKVLVVKADIPSTSENGGLQAWLYKAGDITAEGVSSGVAITTTAASWSSVKGNYMSKGAPGLVIRRADTPATQTLIKNTSGATVATMNLTASSTEDLTITKIRISGAATDTASSSLAQGREAFDQTNSDAELGTVVHDMVGNLKLYVGGAQIGLTVPVMEAGSSGIPDYADFTGLSLKIPKGTTKAVDIKLDVTSATTTSGNSAVYFFFGISSSTSDVAGSGDYSGTALSSATISNGGASQPGNGMRFGSGGTLTLALSPDSANSAELITGAGANVGSWTFIASNEGINITRLAFTVTTSTAATGTSEGYAATPATSTVSFPTTTAAFQYSLNDAATSECAVGTTTGPYKQYADLATEITRDCGLVTSYTAGGKFRLSTSTAYSVEITDASVSATNIADDLRLGLKYGGTETIGAYAGSEASFGNAYLYEGATLLGTAAMGGLEGGKVVFIWADSAPLSVIKGTHTYTLKTDVNDYQALTEGANIYFTLGSTVGTGLAIEGKGAQSGTELGDSNVATSSLAANTMYLYATKPTVTKNTTTISPVKGTLETVYRFDVTNNGLSDLNINAIRFTISSAATATWVKTWKLYKTTDTATAIGAGTSWANTSTTDTTGWVAIYPYSNSGFQVTPGSTNSYILKGDTSSMDITTGNDNLTIYIDNDDFYWDDSVYITGASNANKKVNGLPTDAITLSY